MLLTVWIGEAVCGTLFKESEDEALAVFLDRIQGIVSCHSLSFAMWWLLESIGDSSDAGMACYVDAWVRGYKERALHDDVGGIMIKPWALRRFNCNAYKAKVS